MIGKDQLYIPKAQGNRGHFFPAWIRWPGGVIIATAAIYLCIRLFFGLMPVADHWLRAHGLLP